ncbi:hypothetical protein ED855_19730, partial [Acinetobacter baumannii]
MGVFKNPQKFFPRGKIFPRGKNFWGPPFSPKKGEKPPGVFKNPRAEPPWRPGEPFKKGPLFGVLKTPKIFPGGKFFPGEKFWGPLFP